MRFTRENLQTRRGYREARVLAEAVGLAPSADDVEVADLVLWRGLDLGDGRRRYKVTVDVLARGEGRIIEAATQAAKDQP
jgi:hypothetical protein